MLGICKISAACYNLELIIKNMIDFALLHRRKFRNLLAIRKRVEGVDDVVSYYNEKYPERPKINHVTQNYSEVRKGREETIRSLRELLKAQPLEPVKIIFTLYAPVYNEVDGEFGHLNHSDPILLTKDKLILLRDSKTFGFGGFTLRVIAEKLGLQFVEQRSTTTSIQGDGVSCSSIALGILKDLDCEDLKKIATFDNGYQPLSKMLKYSQSAGHLEEFDKEIQEFPVKKGGKTLSKYVEEGKLLQKDGGRIYGKIDKIRKILLRRLAESSVEAGEASAVSSAVSPQLSFGAFGDAGGAGMAGVDVAAEGEALISSISPVSAIDNRSVNINSSPSPCSTSLLKSLPPSRSPR